MTWCSHTDAILTTTEGMSTFMVIIYIMMYGSDMCLLNSRHCSLWANCDFTLTRYLESISWSIESVDKNLLVQLIPSKSSRKPGWHPQVKLPCVLIQSWLHWLLPNAHSFISNREMIEKVLVYAFNWKSGQPTEKFNSMYSRTPLLQTPWDYCCVSRKMRCPHFRDSE